MKLRKGSIGEILWFIAIIVVFSIITISTIAYSNVETIDTYAKNIINSESTAFVNSIAGFSTSESTLNMFTSSGVKRTLGTSSNTATSLSDSAATAYGIYNFANKKMVENIKQEFKDNPTLEKKVLDIDNIEIKTELVDKTNRSLIVTVTVRYKVEITALSSSDSGIFGKVKFEIPREVVSTRTVENPLRFKEVQIDL